MRLYGLIGYPVKHSFSGFMHNAAFKNLGIDAEYCLFELKPEEVRDFLLEPDKEFRDITGESFRAGDILGFNITIPHKVKAREILEEKFPFEITPPIVEDLYYVKLSGAVNTVRRDSDGLKYWNTDAQGFLKSVREKIEDWQFDPTYKSVLLVGCGGAGRAVIAGLSWKDNEIKKIYIYDISKEAIDSLKKHFSKLSEEFKYWQDILEQKIEFISKEQIPETINKCQLLVNATPIGMEEGNSSVIDKNLLHKDLYVYDVVYNRETELIKDAKSLGLSAKRGDGMLLYQGVDAFEFWTGRRAPVDVMQEALKSELKKINHS